MHPFKLRREIQSGLVVGLVALGLLVISLGPWAGVQAGLEKPSIGQDDDYPPPGETREGYPPPDETQPTSGSQTPGAEQTQAITPGVTEEMPTPGEETITPPVAGTRQATPAVTTTLDASPTPQSTSDAALEEDQGQFKMNWGFFWIGFAIPILGGSGVVLYLLDRRPDLFKPRSKF